MEFYVIFNGDLNSFPVDEKYLILYVSYIGDFSMHTFQIIYSFYTVHILINQFSVAAIFCLGICVVFHITYHCVPLVDTCNVVPLSSPLIVLVQVLRFSMSQ